MTEPSLAHWRAVRDVVVAGTPHAAGDTFEASPDSIGFAAFAHGMVVPVEAAKKKGEELPP